MEDWTPILHLVEWVIAPLGMFLLLFSWRDKLSILHMPWADFVALIVIADIAFAINYKDLPDLTKNLSGFVTRYDGNWVHWLELAALGVVTCRLLVKTFEKRINDIALHYIAAGWLRKRPEGHLSIRNALRNRKWWAFTLLWSASVTCVGGFLAAHSFVIGLNISVAWLPELNLTPPGAVLAFVAFAFAISVLLCLAFVATGYCRVYPQAIPQT